GSAARRAWRPATRPASTGCSAGAEPNPGCSPCGHPAPRRRARCASPSLTSDRRKELPVARVKRSVHSKKKRRVTLERAKGYYGNKSRSYRAANEQVMHSLQYAYRDRRARKGDFRRLWIQRINAACRQNGTSYSVFVAGLRTAGIEVDRKVLADLAVTDEAAFASLVTTARAALDDAGATATS